MTYHAKIYWVGITQDDMPRTDIPPENLSLRAVENGDYYLLEIFNGGRADNIDIERNAELRILSGGGASNIRVSEEGQAMVLDAFLNDADIFGTLHCSANAVLSNITVHSMGTFIASAAECTQLNVSGFFNLSQGIIHDFSIKSGGTAILDSATGITVTNMTVKNNASLILGGNVTLAGEIILENSFTATKKINAADATANCKISDLPPNATPLINDWEKTEFGRIAITIGAQQPNGIYNIVGNVHHKFNHDIEIRTDNGTNTSLGYCTTMVATDYCDDAFAMLRQNGETLSVVIGQNVDIDNNLTIRTIKYAIRAIGMTENVIRTILPQDDSANIIYLTARGKWSGAFFAQNCNTREIISLEGFHCFNDIIVSQNEASILILSHENDSIFADDIFSPFPDNVPHRQRLEMISEIRANDGDDLIDLTLGNFTQDINPDIILRGGAGNDIIWGGNGGNVLLGDSGNDNIVGGTGNDILAGGAGNDILRGFGGCDIYAFGASCGIDQIFLEDNDENYIIWLSNDWEGGTLSYQDNTATIMRDNDNFIIVNNITGNNLGEHIVMGDMDGDVIYEQTYVSLTDLGAFDADSTLRPTYAIPMIAN